MNKEIEKILIKYKTIDLRIENIDDRINMLIDDVKISNISYEQRLRGTNAFSSSIENEVIRREETNSSQLAQLKNVKNELILFRSIVYRALSILDKIELDIITMRYLHKDKKSWVEIGMSLGFEKDYCCKKRNKIFIKLEPLLADI
ncbi:MAG: hypothetical protein PWP67_2008 [Clostridium butyricum]|nr:hypothetical protein [Clostridium butyricum]